MFDHFLDVELGTGGEELVFALFVFEGGGEDPGGGADVVGGGGRGTGVEEGLEEGEVAAFGGDHEGGVAAIVGLVDRHVCGEKLLKLMVVVVIDGGVQGRSWGEVEGAEGDGGDGDTTGLAEKGRDLLAVGGDVEGGLAVGVGDGGVGTEMEEGLDDFEFASFGGVHEGGATGAVDVVGIGTGVEEAPSERIISFFDGEAEGGFLV